MEELDNVVDEEKDLSCSTDLNIKEDKKKTLIMRSGYLIVALLLGIFTELYLAVIGLVAITFFMPDLLHVSKMKLKQSVKKILLVVLCVLLIFGIRWTFYEVRFAIYVKEFREDYGIHLAKEQNEQKVKITYRLKDVTDTKNLCDKLSGVLKCLDQLPEGLMEEIKEPIYMETKDGTEQLVPEGEIQIIFSDTIGGKAAGIVEFGIGWDMMALDANSNRSIDKLFYHEFSHLLDKRNSWKSFASDSRYRKEWGTVNPNGFKYGYENYDYVMGECQSKELVAFISEYATANIDEDRAELFSYLMTLEDRTDFEELMSYPRIAEKIKYLNASLVEEYDCFDEDNCFQWQMWLSDSK